MDSRITFKLGVDYDKVAAARVGFHVEKNAINSLKNINEIYDFDLFFSYINNEFRKRMKKMKNDDVLHPVDVLTDLLIHLVSLTRADDEESSTRGAALARGGDHSAAAQTARPRAVEAFRRGPAFVVRGG